MALSADTRVDEPGGMIGLNGSLVAVLCGAYFVLLVCALSSGPSIGADPRPAQNFANKMEPSPGRWSREVTRNMKSRAPVVVAYARAAMDQATRSRRTDDMIGAIVLSLRRTQQGPIGHPSRTVRCDRQRRATSCRGVIARNVPARESLPFVTPQRSADPSSRRT
jgi:hypothetical protein